MYVCPICNREFKNSEDVAKHTLICWREKNPNYKSKPAPRSEDVINRKVDASVLDFFASLRKEK